MYLCNSQFEKMINAKTVKQELFSIAIPGKQKILSSFFKTGKGEYGEGDLFIGVTVPQQRQLVKTYKQIPLDEIEQLLQDEYHECRMTGFFFLIALFEKSKDEQERERFFRFYMDHLYAANNWDLVDLTAPKIIGEYLLKRDRSCLYELVQSADLWEQRVAVISTFRFIKANDFDDTFRISELLLEHTHDLIQKAVGWMLREIGKRDYDAEYRFLSDRYQRMPRTMLRYAIEKFDEKVRLEFLKRK